MKSAQVILKNSDGHDLITNIIDLIGSVIVALAVTLVIFIFNFISAVYL